MPKSNPSQNLPKTTSLRVLSGQYRGRILQSPQSALTHPMGAREKLALFNMVSVEHQRVLDAYAGSGALGIEALSRGASEVVFVENNAKIMQILQANLANLGLSAQTFLERVAVFAQDPAFQAYFEVILADPPYDKVNPDYLATLAQLLASGGTLALSSPKELGEISLPGLRISSAHSYARAQITIYRKD